MKIAIDAREVSVNKYGGLRSYAESVVASLISHNLDYDLSIYIDRNYDTSNFASSTAKWNICLPTNLIIREQLTLPIRMKADKISLCHFLANTAPVSCDIPYILTLHDTFCIERPFREIFTHGNIKNKALSIYSKIVPCLAAKKAEKIVTVSKYSAKQIADKLDINIDNIVVIPQAMQARFKPVDATDMRKYIKNCLNTSKIILVIGSPEPRKNVANVLKSIASVQDKCSDLGVVLTWSNQSSFKLWMKQNSVILPQRIFVMEKVSNDDLVKLYSCADIFMFMSTNEGFGLPVIEAMACGCPVITSNNSCLPETAGDAAILADPYDIDEIANYLIELSENIDKRNDLKHRGFLRSADFSETNAAIRLTNLYTNVCNSI